MNKATFIDDATRLLVKILDTQPNLLRPMAADTSEGRNLADFVDAFIRRYSEHLQALTGEKSQ